VGLGSSKVFVEAETAAILIGLWCFGFLGLLRRCHDTSLLVVADTLLEKVGLASQGDGFHKVERIGDVVALLVAKRDEETVGDEFDVLFHEGGIHAEQRARESLRKELLLDADGFGYDVLDSLLGWTLVDVGEKEAGKVGVETLITGDELVRERQARHEASLLEPEDGRERAGKEDTLHGSEGDEALCESRVLVGNPAESPVGLLPDARDWKRGWSMLQASRQRGRAGLTGVDCVEEIRPLLRVLDVRVDEERVRLGVNVLHHDLEAIEAACLGNLHFSAEAFDKVLVDDPVRSGEEGEDVRDKVSLVIVHPVVPVVQILGEINLLGSPEGRLCLFVHLPDLCLVRLEKPGAFTREDA
jgi:hypothetical protein